MSAEENKAAQRRIIEEVINRKDLDLADELFSEEHELRPEAAGVARGPEGMKRAFAGLHEGFPDIHVEIEDMVAEGEVVAVRLTFSGTHAPTGERATWPEMVFGRFSGGQGGGELGGDGHRARLGQPPLVAPALLPFSKLSSNSC